MTTFQKPSLCANNKSILKTWPLLNRPFFLIQKKPVPQSRCKAFGSPTCKIASPCCFKHLQGTCSKVRWDRPMRILYKASMTLEKRTRLSWIVLSNSMSGESVNTSNRWNHFSCSIKLRQGGVAWEKYGDPRDIFIFKRMRNCYNTHSLKPKSEMD